MMLSAQANVNDWTPIHWLVSGTSRDALVAADRTRDNPASTEWLRQHVIGLSTRVLALLGTWDRYDGDAYDDSDEALIWPDLELTGKGLARLQVAESDARFGLTALATIGAAMRALRDAARRSCQPALREAFIVERGCLAALGLAFAAK
jgi:hypothetical protein